MSDALLNLGLIFMGFAAVYIVGCLFAGVLGFRRSRPMATRTRSGSYYQGPK